MPKLKKLYKKTKLNFLALMICLIGLLLMAGIFYLLYNEGTRIYIMSIIILSWIFSFWELYNTPNSSKSAKQGAS